MYPSYGSYYDDFGGDDTVAEFIVPPSSFDPTLYDNVPLSAGYGLFADYTQPLYQSEMSVSQPIYSATTILPTSPIESIEFSPIPIESVELPPIPLIPTVPQLVNTSTVISDTIEPLNQPSVYSYNYSNAPNYEVISDNIEVLNTPKQLLRNGFVKVNSRKTVLRVITIETSSSESSDDESDASSRTSEASSRTSDASSITSRKRN